MVRSSGPAARQLPLFIIACETISKEKRDTASGCMCGWIYASGSALPVLWYSGLDRLVNLIYAVRKASVSRPAKQYQRRSGIPNYQVDTPWAASVWQSGQTVDGIGNGESELFSKDWNIYFHNAGYNRYTWIYTIFYSKYIYCSYISKLWSRWNLKL